MCISSISLSKMSLVNYVYSLEQSDLNTFSIWTKFVSALLKNNFRTHCVLLFYNTEGDEIEHVLQEHLSLYQFCVYKIY